jgi:hypothetical protein
LAEVTKVSARVVAALEDGRLDIVPGGVYRRSLVRLIAAEVGLPAEETLRAFLAEHPDELPAPGETSQPEETPVAARGGWRRVFAMLGALVPLLVGVAYFARPAPEGLGRETSSRAASSADRDSWRPEIVPAGGFGEAPPPAAHPVMMMITVSHRSVLRVVADGGLVVGRRFEAGETFRVAFSDAVELAGDNAGAVQFSINGRAGRMLGAAGEMLSVRIGREDYPFFLAGR